MIDRFLITTRVGRAIIIAIHRAPLHRGLRNPLTFAEFGCVLCRWHWRELRKHVPSLASEFQDENTIKLSDPEYNEDGTLKRRGVHMSTQVRRFLDGLDPDEKAKVDEAINNLAKPDA